MLDIISQLDNYYKGNHLQRPGPKLGSPKSVRGVYKKKNKWAARIIIKNHEIYLGSFEDKFDAICARKSAENRKNILCQNL